MFKKIVIAVDGSNQSTSAFNLAVSIAGSESELHLVHALLVGVPVDNLYKIAEREGFAEQISDELASVDIAPIVAPVGTSMIAGVIPALSLKKFGKLLLDKMTAKISRRDVGVVHKHIIGGDPAKAIMQCAKGQNADVIVMGCRGHGKLKSLVMGSISQTVVAEANCPVLITKKDNPEVVS